MPLAASKISLLSIVLLSLPADPVVVLNTIVPLVVLVLALFTLQYIIELELASLINWTAYEVPTFVFSIESSLAVPVPPGLPSKIILLPAFKFKVPVVLLEVIIKLVAPVSGLKVMVLIPLLPVNAGKVIGKVSTLEL